MKPEGGEAMRAQGSLQQCRRYQASCVNQARYSGKNASGEAKVQTTQHQGCIFNEHPAFLPNPSSFSFWTGSTSSFFFHWKWKRKSGCIWYIINWRTLIYRDKRWKKKGGEKPM